MRIIRLVTLCGGLFVLGVLAPAVLSGCSEAPNAGPMTGLSEQQKSELKASADLTDEFVKSKIGQQKARRK